MKYGPGFSAMDLRDVFVQESFWLLYLTPKCAVGIPLVTG